ncbi:hypothetical protein CDD82_1345 [Ophiocordyceps australis]|uniref:Uncharacterized protein n=1 Tax=Ophiocordyceps australis TaxID=1399860 RepID=A0A2C5ZVK3_9HYPO|nr:hypothetical protein CDD82_1345 [Ophiocordyceps australis]
MASTTSKHQRLAAVEISSSKKLDMAKFHTVLPDEANKGLKTTFMAKGNTGKVWRSISLVASKSDYFFRRRGVTPSLYNMALEARRLWQIGGLLPEPERSTQPTIPIDSRKNSEASPTTHCSFHNNLDRNHSEKFLKRTDTTEYLEGADVGNIQQHIIAVSWEECIETAAQGYIEESQYSDDGPENYDEDIEILGNAGPGLCRICHQPGALITRLCRNCEIAWVRARGGSEVSKSLLMALAS